MCAGAAVLLSGCHMGGLSPKGDIGMEVRSLSFIALGLMSLVVIPV
ncbi:MAG: cytochrome ubiquinol oxidase subunit II, partial [Delftia sp.]|nr:cytochrome ubiquinol oxidase subunit II [Delftia sp.]